MRRDDVITGVLYEGDSDVNTIQLKKDVFDKEVVQDKKQEIIWARVTFFVLLHLFSIYGIYLAFTAAQWKTLAFAVFLYFSNCFGVTGGVHRLWAHRSYKATWQLRLILVVLYTMAHQFSIYQWARDHRVHHKYVETSADPHNAKRGFFYSHVGWFLVTKNQQTKDKGKGIDLSDLEADPFVMFQHRHFAVLVVLACYVIPAAIPVYLWNETWASGFYICGALRHCTLNNASSCVNSVAHLWGSKPYDKSINPVNVSWVSSLVMGEGWHNYHHVFPWDYKTSEFGDFYNPTARLIELFAKIGWAYDLKSVESDMVKRRVERTGDGSHSKWGKNPLYGWGDKDQTAENRQFATVSYPKQQ